MLQNETITLMWWSQSASVSPRKTEHRRLATNANLNCRIISWSGSVGLTDSYFSFNCQSFSRQISRDLLCPVQATYKRPYRPHIPQLAIISLLDAQSDCRDSWKTTRETGSSTPVVDLGLMTALINSQVTSGVQLMRLRRLLALIGFRRVTSRLQGCFRMCNLNLRVESAQSLTGRSVR